VKKIKNLKKIAKRIKKAIEKEEKLIFFSDADLDGVASAIILKETIRNLGGKVFLIFFPDLNRGRKNEFLKFLEIIKKEKPALVFLLDFGSGDFEGVKLAKKLGFELILIDHHQIFEKIPKNLLVLNPHQSGDQYPFKDFATAGLVFKIAQELFKNRLSKSLEKDFLELVALATIYDMMPKEEDNEILIEMGLNSLPTTLRPGLRVLLELIEPDLLTLDLYQLASKIISVLSCANSTKDHLTEAYLLLTQTNQGKAKELAHFLLEKVKIKKAQIKEIIEEIKRKTENKKEAIIFEGNERWQPSLLGSAASKIVQELKKPTFLYHKGKERSLVSCRMPEDIDGLKAVRNCSQFLETFGGHPLAFGVTLANKNLKKFKECLQEYFEKLSE
jgi:single-stranded-DNA-specific exonuclease